MDLQGHDDLYCRKKVKETESVKVGKVKVSLMTKDKGKEKTSSSRAGQEDAKMLVKEKDASQLKIGGMQRKELKHKSILQENIFEALNSIDRDDSLCLDKGDCSNKGESLDLVRGGKERDVINGEVNEALNDVIDVEKDGVMNQGVD
ncbi:unnamed protein product [Ilex paraguariensis]|uniref:Uncharacterized protein n=1 Tax=Ilex paraguariensis TaxID=185542 RepID=A0ABC8RHD7_9AQUA